MGELWLERLYKEGDEAKIYDLWRVVYPDDERNWAEWIKWWDWLYGSNPRGTPKIWLAEHITTGAIIGQSAIIPVGVKVGQKIVTGFQSIDTMTHPEYRGLGIYTTLAKRAYEDAKNEGWSIGYRFPNRFSYPIAVKKLGWFDIATMQILLKPLNWANTLKLKISNRFLLRLGAIGGSLVDRIFYRAKKAPIVEGLKISRVTSFDERLNEFWNKIAPQYPIIVVKDSDYLNWRYINVPGRSYVVYVAESRKIIQGFVVFRCTHWQNTKVVMIFDVLAQTEQIILNLLMSVSEYCLKEEVDLISCDMTASKLYLRAFKKNGFICLPPMIKGRRLCAYLCDPDISMDFLKNSHNWFAQSGDSDTL